MKKGKRLFAIFAFVMLGLFAFAFTSVTKVHAESNTVTYTVESKTSVSTTGTAPTGSTATYSQTYGTVYQATAGNSFTLTLSGWEGKKITGITLSMKSNKSSGAGKLSVTSGSKSIASIEPAAFNTASWNGAWSNSYVDKVVTLSDSNYTIHEGDDVVIYIEATVNSLFIQSYTITYETGTLVSATGVQIGQTNVEINKGDTTQLTATVSPSDATNTNITWSTGDATIATVDENGVVTGVAAGTTTITATVTGTTISASCNITVNAISQELEPFQNLDLQEQLAFHYNYTAEFQSIGAPVEGTEYLLGSIVNDVTYVASTISLSAVSKTTSALKFTVQYKDTTYFYILTGNRYIKYSGNSSGVSSGLQSDIENNEDLFLWSYDTESNKIVNKKSSRYLGMTDSNNGIKAYTQAGNSIVSFLTTNGDVTFTDKASNENAVTMRIGFTMTKEAYNAIKALDSNATFGVYLNNKEYVACTPVEVNDTTYRFYVAINGITAANYDTVLTAAGYVSANDDVFYTTDVNTYSVKTLAIEYITNHLDDANVLAAKYALTYLAYNA